MYLNVVKGNLVSGKEWIIIGNKFRNFPGVMQDALRIEGVRLFIPEKVSEELLLKIHTPGLVEDLKRAWYKAFINR